MFIPAAKRSSRKANLQFSSFEPENIINAEAYVEFINVWELGLVIYPKDPSDVPPKIAGYFETFP